MRCLIVEKRRTRAKCKATRLPSSKSAYNKLANSLKNINYMHSKKNYILYLSLMGVYGKKPSVYLSIKSPIPSLDTVKY